jgi:hypothetical protein
MTISLIPLVMHDQVTKVFVQPDQVRYVLAATETSTHIYLGTGDPITVHGTIDLICSKLTSPPARA